MATNDTATCSPQEQYLYAGRPPGHELDELSGLNPVECLVDLEGINLTLDDVEQRQIATLPGVRRDHQVLRMKQARHDIQYARLAYANCKEKEHEVSHCACTTDNQ